MSPRNGRSLRTRVWTVASLVVALLAGAVLVAGGWQAAPAPPPGRVSAERAWPAARRGELPGSLPDGPLFQPLLFLDPHTAIGTAPSPDALWLRLLLRGADGGTRMLRRLPYADNPVFDNLTVAGNTVAWTESAQDGRVRIWVLGLDAGGSPRQVTADTGDAVFDGTENGLRIVDGRVYWAAARGTEITEIRSVALSGGAVRVRAEPGRWALSRWPWLTDGTRGRPSTTVLRDLGTGGRTEVRTAGGELATCSPTWCRVTVIDSGELVRIDLMHPDGSGRRTVAGRNALAALDDVAVLDRFEVLSEPGPNSDLTGTAILVSYDLRTGQTVLLSPIAATVFFRNGVLAWSTGAQETTVWHTVDLRTA
ncbi:hypothetical protein [Plantactinospora sp. KBS50]|uniref:hypothetical protein n=1 Tax=Plantactinospora sp. KBS50 TaxID=2024580 RepID=UPI001E481637|nr:hypothetical protein [Plantactinospora sp. KBS50]